jgi:hypothetical protein
MIFSLFLAAGLPLAACLAKMYCCMDSPAGFQKGPAKTSRGSTAGKSGTKANAP